MPEEVGVPAWMQFERVIRSELLEEEQPHRRREAINLEMEKAYEAIRPYLEALEDMSLARAGHRAIEDSPYPRPDDPGRPIWQQEQKAFEAQVKECKERIERLKKEYEQQIQRLPVLRAIRESLGELEEVGPPEPP